MAHVSDRWFTTDQDGTKVKTDRHPDNGGNPGAKRWRVRYTGPDGRERSKSYARKTDADKFRSTTEADLLRGTWTDPAAGRITVREYGTSWLAARSVEENSREQIGRHLALHIYPVLGDTPLGLLAQRPSVIQEWVRGLDAGPVYAGAILGTLSSLLSAALEDGLIPRNPCKASSVKPPKIPEARIVPWPAERVAALREALAPRFQAMADCGAGLGLRGGEAIGLAVEDVDWLRGKVHVRRQVKVVGRTLCFAPPKGGKERDVPLAESVKLRLSAHVGQWPGVPVSLPWRVPGGKPVTAVLLFTRSGGKVIDPRNLHYSVIGPARRKAGIPSAAGGFHQLRHYYASALLADGVDIRTLSEYLGHHDPAFTLRVYCHLMANAEGRARDAIDRALSPAAPTAAQKSRNGG